MLYRGVDIQSGSVTLVAANAESMASAFVLADIDPAEKMWFARAKTDDSIVYFGMQTGDRIIGQIFLHDIAANEGMIGYHIFLADDRQHGYGSDALTTVTTYARRELGLVRLIIITSVDNTASRRLAKKCGFGEIGPAREGPSKVVYEIRDTPPLPLS